MKQKLFTFFFALVASISAIYAQSGTCGSNLTWMLDAETGVLTISGTGAMDNYYYGRVGTVVSPWNEFTSVIKTVIINDGVTSIGNQAFYECSSLTSVTIGESVTSIGNYAFCGCSSITSITIPNSVTSIGNNAFDGCFSLTSVTIGESVTSIGDFAFWYCFSLKYLTIGNSVTSIGNQAFDGCSSLTSVTIPNSVTSIGSFAFQNCSSLTSVTIPNSVTSIGNYAFCGCSSIASPVYNAHCFAYMPTSYSGAYTIPEGIEQIAGGAFAGCSSITSITIPNSVTSIGGSAFYGCSALTSVTIPNSVTSIGGHAFDGCSALTSVTIPNSVTSIGGHAFDGCSALTSVTIPESVTSIGKSAFEGCSSLTSVTWNAKNCDDASASKDAPFYAIRSQITSFTFGENVEHIPAYLCDGMDKLTSVTIPNSVTSIGWAAFYGCSSLTSVTIGNSVTSIGYYAFYGCSSLTSITCEAAIPPTIDDTYNVGDTYTFDGVSKSIPVYVPCGCVKAYKAASGWSDFTNIQEPLEYSIEVYVNDTIMGTAKVNYNTFCEGNQISASPNFGYYFVQWSDGNTDNPRSLVLTQDTILTAEFAQSFSGQCGDSLYWELVDTTLQITGKGEMYDYESNTIPWKQLVSSIKSLSVSEGTTSIGNRAFRDCSSLTSVTIPESVTSIGKSAFEGCSAIDSIVWNAKNCADASSLETAPFYAIRSQITSFTFGENVEHIPAYLCAGMDKLTSMTIPNSVTSIGSRAFYECSSLTSVTIPESVTSIGGSAFSGCSSLTSVTIPESVTSIGNYAFEGCSAIDSIVWNAKNCADASSLETAPFYAIRSQITSFTFGENVEHIPAYLCDGMEKLTSVTIPDSVKNIGTSAFEGCARLGKISLGTGLEEIAANAFAGCTRLYDIYSYATYPPFAEESSFANYNAYLYIPCESKRDYTMDPVWSKFQHIECLSDEPTDMENIETPSQRPTNCQKLLRNGQLLILRDGKTYNAMGQEL